MDHKAITVNLRWLSVLLAGAVLPTDTVITPSQPWVLVALAGYVISNLVLLFLPERLFGYQRAWFALAVFDIAVISVFSHQVALSGGDAFFLYLPAIAWASCHHGQRGVFAATMVAAGADLLVLWASAPQSSLVALFMFGKGHLIGVALILVIGVFSGYQAERLKRQTRDSEALARQHRNLASVLAATRELSASVKQTEVMAMLIQQMVDMVGAFRCSMAHVDEAGRLGTILISREILAAEENFGSRTLSISLRDYPEIRRALETGDTVLVNDVPGEPMLVPVAGILEQIGIRHLLVVPVTVEDPMLGTLMLCMARRSDPFVEDEVRICELVAEVAAGALKNAYMHERLASKNVSLKKLAVSDPLTGLYNRRFFDMRLSEEFRLATRHSLPLAMIMLDVDFFKRINDTHGHQVGDRVLVELTRVVQKTLRQSDCMARFGGEEFVVILPLTDLEGGIAKAEDIRLAVKEMCIDLDNGETLRITMSCGVAQVDAIHCSDQDALVAGADHAVYEAKEGGRDRVCGYAPDAVAAAEAASQT